MMLMRWCTVATFRRRHASETLEAEQSLEEEVRGSCCSSQERPESGIYSSIHRLSAHVSPHHILGYACVFVCYNGWLTCHRVGLPWLGSEHGYLHSTCYICILLANIPDIVLAVIWLSHSSAAVNLVSWTFLFRSRNDKITWQTTEVTLLSEHVEVR